MIISKSDILIIIPVLNEETVIKKVILDVRSAGYSNICVIDDGSSDNTKEIVRSLKVTVLQHVINRGVGVAVQTGLLYARKEGYKYVVLIDGDGQHVPLDIKVLTSKMEETKADIVIGNRFSYPNNEIPKTRLFYNQIANIFTNFFCKYNYQDTQSGFRLLNRKAIESLDLKSSGFDFCSEMVILAEKLNLIIDNAPIRVIYSTYSMNKGQNFRVGVKTARGVIWHKYFESIG